MRPLKIGVQLPEVEYEYTWPQLEEMARIAEEIGLDSIWLGDHLMYRYPDPAQPPRGPFEAWTTLSALAGVTSRVELGPLVASTGFHNPAMIAKMAATIDQISGGRFILGIGSGWHEPEYRGFGFPYDARVSRFEEAFTIIRTLLTTGECTFHGRYFDLDGALLFPRSPRPDGPSIMLGSKGPRMLAIALPHVQMWNAWWADYGNTREGLRDLLGEIDAACERTDRDPGTLIRTICPLVGMGGVGGRPSAGRKADHIIDGQDPAALADELADYAELGVAHVQLVLDPITPHSIANLAPVLDHLDG